MPIEEKLSDSGMKSYGDLYMALVEILGETEAKKFMKPLIDVSIEIAMRRLGIIESGIRSAAEVE